MTLFEGDIAAQRFRLVPLGFLACEGIESRKCLVACVAVVDDGVKMYL
jgi:hypothetical protein